MNEPHAAATRVLAVRHGETDWNAALRMQGHMDIPLNARGRWQAQRLAQALAHEPVAALYASDLSRAHETAQIIAATMGLPVLADAALRERCFGVFEGHSYEKIETQWPQEGKRWRARDPDFGPEGGETLRAFFERSVQTVQRLAAQHTGQTIVIATHGGVLDCLYLAAMRLPLNTPRAWPLGNAVINRLLCTAEGMSIVGWGDDMHLEDASLDESST